MADGSALSCDLKNESLKFLQEQLAALSCQKSEIDSFLSELPSHLNVVVIPATNMICPEVGVTDLYFVTLLTSAPVPGSVGHGRP